VIFDSPECRLCRYLQTCRRTLCTRPECSVLARAVGDMPPKVWVNRILQECVGAGWVRRKSKPSPPAIPSRRSRPGGIRVQRLLTVLFAEARIFGPMMRA